MPARLVDRARGAGLAVFGLLDQACVPELLVEKTSWRLAEAIHQAYLDALERDDKKSAPAAVPWEDLDSEYQASNRQQALHVPVKLGLIGCRLVPLPKGRSSSFRFGPAEVEQLARLEHNRWLNEKLLDGWSHGPDRCKRHKTNPDLKPWEQLSPKEQQKNRAAVLSLPAVLARIGLQIERCE